MLSSPLQYGAQNCMPIEFQLNWNYKMFVPNHEMWTALMIFFSLKKIKRNTHIVYMKFFKLKTK